MPPVRNLIFGFPTCDRFYFLHSNKRGEFQVRALFLFPQVAHFLLKNGFASGSVNERKGKWWVSFPLHVSVKQNNAYITSKLLIFGADPMVKDIWGYTAYDYAKARPNSHQQIIKIFEKSGCSPSSPMWSSSNRFQSVPPPRGFEEFFAKLEEDPLVPWA